MKKSYSKPTIEIVRPQLHDLMYNGNYGFDTGSKGGNSSHPKAKGYIGDEEEDDEEDEEEPTNNMNIWDY
jgi:hypothetical protein